MNNLDYEKNLISNNLIEDVDNIETLVSHFSNELKEKDILEKVELPNGEFYNGKFEDDTWVVFRATTQNYAYIKFDTLRNLLPKISNEEIMYIKCWVAKRLCKNYMRIENRVFANGKKTLTTTKVVSEVSEICNFIKASNNFSKNFLNINKGEQLETYFFDRFANFDVSSSKFPVLNAIIDYLSFAISECSSKNDFFDLDVYSEYVNRITQIKNDSNQYESNTKKMTFSKDVILFDYYINMFFIDSKISKTAKDYFKPILLWWKITNVIPMRPNEFSSAIPRDCLIKENNNYFLKINRSKKKPKNKRKLPLLTKIKITEEIYKLINDYIEQTNNLGETATLLSYRAYLYYRKKLEDEGLFEPGPLDNKYNELYFSDRILQRILDNFYTKIINKWYKDMSVNNSIRLNHTRHFAFTTLVLQGIPSIEIAILGGHDDIRSLNSYTSNTNIYIDREVFVSINKNISVKTVDDKELYNIVFNKPNKCPIDIEKCIETEFDGIQLGVCTTLNHTDCESYHCYNCSKWYCEPTQYSLNMLREIVKNDLIKRKISLDKNVAFYEKLFHNSALVSSNEDSEEVGIELNDYTKMKQLSLEIQSQAKEIVGLKTKLTSSLLPYSDYTKDDILDKLELLNEVFSEETKYLT